jgi:hypothetical protein
VDKKKNKRKIKKKRNKKGSKLPTTSRHVGKQPVTDNRVGSVDDAKNTQTTRNPKYPCRICKGIHLLNNFPILSKVIEAWSTCPLQPMSSTYEQHVDDIPSSSDIMVCKKQRTVKFPFLLCEGDHYSHLLPHMYEASYVLEKLQLPMGYCNIYSNPSLVYGLVNPVPSPVSLVDQVINMVSSSVEPKTQVVDPFPSLINPTLHLNSKTQVIDPVTSLIIPTPPLKSVKLVDLVPSSINHTPPLKSVKMINPVLPSIDPTPPSKSATKVVNLVLSSVNPTPKSNSEDVA